MDGTRKTARARTFMLGIWVGLFGLGMLLAIVLIGGGSAWWRFLFLVAPLVFAAAALVDLVRSMHGPDEPVG